MTTRMLLISSLQHHWRMHVALVLCAAVGAATLTGALIVGDSMRGSLRDNALKRLGPVHYAMRSPRFIRAETAKAVDGCGIVLLQGGIEHAKTKSRANRVQIVGADDQFWEMWLTSEGRSTKDSTTTTQAIVPDGRHGNGAVLNESLAGEIGAAVGDEVLIRLARQSVVPADSVLGRPDETAATLRLSVSEIVGDDGVGGFSLDASQAGSFNIIVPIDVIQRTLDREDRINAILVAGVVAKSTDRVPQSNSLDSQLAQVLSLSDYELSIRVDSDRGYFSVESNRMLLEPAVEKAIWNRASKSIGDKNPVLAYLANNIERLGTQGEVLSAIPYSIVAAVGTISGLDAASSLGQEMSSEASLFQDDEILLNAWAADDLGASDGDRIRLTYYVTGRSGELETQSHEFKLRSIIPMSEEVADPGFLPPYPGISDANTLGDWDPPTNFKIDLKRIQPKDEQYWKEHKGSPKAFISIQAGQKLWAEKDSRFGRLTAIRIRPGKPEIESAVRQFGEALLDELKHGSMGIAFEAVRDRAIAAGTGSTDFGMLFVSFSFFIIASAALLVALVFRLNLERRAGEIGLLTAIGFSNKIIGRLFLAEGAILAAVGSAIGLACSAGYAWLMLAGLRTFWAGAVNSPFLTLHVSPTSITVGFAASFLVAAFSLRLAMRGLAKLSPRMLLAGVATAEYGIGRSTHRRKAPWVFMVALVMGLGLIGTAAASDAIPQALAFFGAGGALLVGGMAAVSIWMGRRTHAVISRGGPIAMARLGLRNATRNSGRSMMTAGLIASASFVVIAVDASRHGADLSSLEKTGGAGGYQTIVESSVALPFDMGTAGGRENLGLSDETIKLLSSATVMALRLRQGDDASCLNLYQVARPRILGATGAFIRRGGFAFQKSMATTEAEKANPWTLLERNFDDGAIPAIGDANTLMWLLKVGLGNDFEMVDDLGVTRKLRIVGMLSGSVLQSELVISEPSFKRLFPGVSGYGFVMVDSGARAVGQVIAAMEYDLARFGADATSTLDRLNQFRAVENTYMSAFGMLGGIGLLLGSLGLAAVMLRNVLERRGEIALLQAVGFSKSRIALTVLAENGALQGAGLLVGGISALTAVLPHVLSRTGDFDGAGIARLFAMLIAVGMVSAGLAVRSAVKGKLLSALRRE